MFKKVLSMALAFSMVMSVAATAMAAISSPIYGIEGNSYAYDKDAGAVDLTHQNPAFSYGDTVYYPLLSNKGSEENNKVTEAEKNLTEANTALKTAKEALAQAEKSLNDKEAALVSAKDKLSKAELVKASADEWKASSDGGYDDEEQKQLSYNEALKNYDSEAEPSLSGEEAVRTSEEALNNETRNVETKTAERDEAKAAIGEKQADVKAKEAVVLEKQQALNDALKASDKYVSASEDVRGIKVKTEWDLNGNAVEDVSLTKKKASAAFEMTNKYIYFVAVELKDSKATGETDIIGTVSMKKTGAFDYEDMQLDVNLTVGYPEAEDNVITKDPMIFSEGSGFSSDKEDELRFDFDDDAYFVVDTLGQGKLLLSADNEFDANIAMIYNAANLNFFNGNGASFNKIGTLYIPAPEGSFLYRQDKDGRLTRENAPYDKDEEAFAVRTRTLGKFVISDVDLKVASKPTSPNSNGGVVNPQTGANI